MQIIEDRISSLENEMNYTKQGADFYDNLQGKIDELNDILDEMRVIDDIDQFTWAEVEEFGRNAFYRGREVSGYDHRGRKIFKRPTYNGYLRELDETKQK